MAQNIPSIHELPIDWDALQAFVTEHQRLDRAGKCQLTSAQRAAIHALLPPPNLQTGTVMDDNVNYIGHLNQYLQRNYKNASVQFVERDVIVAKTTGAGFEVLWHCTCTIPAGESEDSLIFPVLVEGKPPALFARKQQAKQWAAYTACAYLDEIGKLDLPAKSNKRLAPLQPVPAFITERSTPTSPAPVAQQQPITGGGAPVSTKEKKDIVARVMALAKELELPPPTYAWGQAEDGSWSATCNFMHPAYPDDLGTVRGASTGKGAQMQAANQVWQWLESEKTKRENMFAAFIGEAN